MSTPVPQDVAGGAVPRATQLIADVRSRDEALRQEAEHLVRLREAARMAAEQEAAAIVARARADIRRILGDARAALLALKSQLEEIAEARPEVDAALRALGEELSADHTGVTSGDDDVVPDRVREIQGELQRMFAESETDLSALAPSSAPSNDTETSPAPTLAHEPLLELSDADPKARGRRLLTIFATIAILGAAGVSAWWYVAVRPATRQTSVVVIPQAPAIPTAPAAATEIPTVSGSLIALPPRAEPRTEPAAAPAVTPENSSPR